MLIRSRKTEVEFYAAREEAGAAGAAIAAAAIREQLSREGRAAAVFASTVSQDPFLAALRTQEINWPASRPSTWTDMQA